MNTGVFQMNCNKGFTLLELLVVVLIIGILAAIALPQYQKAVVKSRLASTMPNVKTLAQAAEIYYLDHGEYPEDDVRELEVLQLSGCTAQNGGEYYCGHTRINLNSGTPYTADAENVRGYVWSGRIVVSYVQYLNHTTRGHQKAGQRRCEATDNSQMAHWVCQSIGGTLISGRDYRLP